ncbi:Allantoinase, partial [Mucuna pruriens]
MEKFLWRVLPLLTILVSFLVFFYLQDSYRAQSHPLIELPGDNCTLLHHRHFWISSKRIVTPQGIISGSVEIKEGKIIYVIEGYDVQGKSKQEKKHVHLDEPGRTEREGFDIPKLLVVLEAAENKIYVDVGFLGGLIPENALNTSILEGLLSAGVLGLKSFMCPSGINDFPTTTIDHIKEGLSVLARYRRPLLVHSEMKHHSKSHLEFNDKGGPRAYLTYLHTRPPEEAAIKELVGVTKHTRIGGPLEGAHVHIAHLSDSSASLDLIKEAKSRGDSISVETCPHYLAFSAEEIPNGDTRFKCSPPIRDAFNKEKLWEAVLEGHIDLLSSDHSPTVPQLKLLEEGDFLRAWGGISSLQFDLPVTWSSGKKYGLTLEQLSLLWSRKPATFAGLESK